MTAETAQSAKRPLLDTHVDAVRRFNRFWTRCIGVLDEGYLQSPFSLAEVRILYELAHQAEAPATASTLARALELDPGYLSRILQRFSSRGLVQRSPSERDGRESMLSLTPSGHAAFDPLERAARDQIADLLGNLSELDRQRLVRDLGGIERILGERPSPHASPSPYILREHRPGDMGWVVQRHGALYYEEYGWDTEFEALVAGIVARFIDHFDPAGERCWIAERDGQNVGCIFLVRTSRRKAKLRLFLVEPDARGLGIGHRLVDECLRFARDAGYFRVRLWTQSNLLAARHIYSQFGFTKIAEEPHHSYSQALVAETWEVRL